MEEQFSCRTKVFLIERGPISPKVFPKNSALLGTFGDMGTEIFVIVKSEELVGIQTDVII